MNRYQLCAKYGWAFSSNMPDRYIERKGIIFDQIAEKGDVDQTTRLQKENRNLMEKMETMEREYDKVRKALEFIIPLIEDMDTNDSQEVNCPNPTFRKPPDFNMKNFFGSSFGICKGKSTKEVTFRFSPVKSRWIRDQVWHKNQKARFLEDGSLELTFPVADFSEIKMEILKHGSMVEVIRPKSLRDLIKAEAEEITQIY